LVRALTIRLDIAGVVACIFTPDTIIAQSLHNGFDFPNGWTRHCEQYSAPQRLQTDAAVSNPWCRQ